MCSSSPSKSKLRRGCKATEKQEAQHSERLVQLCWADFEFANSNHTQAKAPGIQGLAWQTLRDWGKPSLYPPLTGHTNSRALPHTDQLRWSVSIDLDYWWCHPGRQSVTLENRRGDRNHPGELIRRTCRPRRPRP